MGGWGLGLKQQRQRNVRPHGPAAFVVPSTLDDPTQDHDLANSASVFSPLMASIATLALKIGERFLRGLLMSILHSRATGPG